MQRLQEADTPGAVAACAYASGNGLVFASLASNGAVFGCGDGSGVQYAVLAWSLPAAAAAELLLLLALARGRSGIPLLTLPLWFLVVLVTVRISPSLPETAITWMTLAAVAGHVVLLVALRGITERRARQAHERLQRWREQRRPRPTPEAPH